MESAAPMLISVDVGGTLGRPDGPGLVSALAEASPLSTRAVRLLLRDLLHTAPVITESLIERVCRTLEIPSSAFPREWRPAPLRLFDGVPQALRELSEFAPIVTLSNVTCVEVDSGRLRDMLSPWVRDHYPSCELGYAKPDPRAFQAVADLCGVPVAGILHIGDHWECDVRGAIASGARAVWVTATSVAADASSTMRSNVLVATDLGDVAKQVRTLWTRRSR